MRLGTNVVDISVVRPRSSTNPRLDETLMAAAQIRVAAQEPLLDESSALDLAAVYGWLHHRAQPDPVTGLRIYPSPTQTAAWLQRHRAERDTQAA